MLMPDWLAVVLLGLIEGVTEFLPISSTGHLIMAEHWLRPRSDVFNTVIQSGAVLAVILIFTGRIKNMLLNWREPETQDFLFKFFTAFAVTSAGGLILKHFGFKLPESPIPVALATLIGGILILVIERWLKGKEASETISWSVAVAVGVAQIGAMVFPGLSRSGATILTAMAMGLSRPAATEFSFLLGIPTLVAAGLVQALSAVLHHEGPQENWRMLLLGAIVAAVTAFAVVRWLLRFVQSHTFNGFGWYRIALGLALLLMWLT